MTRPSPLLASTRSLIGPSPRELPGDVLLRLRPDRPAWMREDDALHASYRAFNDILARGDLTWGYVVQANGVLWQPGRAPAPALLVHGVDPDDDPVPSTLEQTARRIGGLRGAKPLDADWARLAREVEHEAGRPLRQPVPSSLAPGPAVALSTVLVYPRQLPRLHLVCGLLPLLLHRRSDALIVLPDTFWADDLRRTWLEWEPT
jgi:hypothetical protein